MFTALELVGLPGVIFYETLDELYSFILFMETESGSGRAWLHSFQKCIFIEVDGLFSSRIGSYIWQEFHCYVMQC